MALPWARIISRFQRLILNCQLSIVNSQFSIKNKGNHWVKTRDFPGAGYESFFFFCPLKGMNLTYKDNINLKL